MMNLAINDHRLARPDTQTAALRDYDSVRRAIAFISEHWRTQPTIEAVADSDVVLLPGFPLTNEDHAWLSALLLARLDIDARIALYAEQPYAAWAHEAAGDAQPDRDWHAIKAPASIQAVKLRACRAYKSQIPMLGGMRVVLGILSYEAQLGGESICWSQV